MRALVVSGGGSKGAFAGGIAESLIKDKGYNYDLFLGSSTGALLVPILATGDIDRIREIYTNVSMNDIFNVNPFHVKEVNGFNQISINHVNILRMFLKGKSSFGDSLNLKELIKRTFTKDDFQKIKDNNKDVVVSVANFTHQTMEYKSMSECTHKDFCDWIWLSSNFVPFMSLAEKNGCEYADGGFGTMVPIMEAIRRGATKVDVIILKMERPEIRVNKAKNAFSGMFNAFDFMLRQIEIDDVRIGKYEALTNNVTLNLYYMRRKLTENSLIFDKEVMNRWWIEGIEYGKIYEPEVIKLHKGEVPHLDPDKG